MKDVFGDHSSVILSGDNYHYWDRNKPSWKLLTHLHPSANNLELFAKHFICLVIDFQYIRDLTTMILEKRASLI